MFDWAFDFDQLDSTALNPNSLWQHVWESCYVEPLRENLEKLLYFSFLNTLFYVL